MATLAILPNTPLAFSDVIDFFDRGNPAQAAGNFPPRGGFALTGFSEVTPTTITTWPNDNSPIEGEADGLTWRAKTDNTGAGQIDVSRAYTLAAISASLLVTIADRTVTPDFNITVRASNGQAGIGSATINTSTLTGTRLIFPVLPTGNPYPLPNLGILTLSVESTQTSGWSYTVEGVVFPNNTNVGTDGFTFAQGPQPERLSWYNRGGGIVPSTATFTTFEFRRTYRPNTLSVADGNFAVKDRIQDTSSTQMLAPFGDTWPNNVFVSVAAIYLVSIDADYNAVETFFGITFNGNVQSLLGYFIRFTHPGGTATYPVTSVRVGAAELWVQFQHEVQSETGVPPADGTETVITLLDSGAGTTQQINTGVDTAAGAVNLASLRNVDNGVL